MLFWDKHLYPSTVLTTQETTLKTDIHQDTWAADHHFLPTCLFPPHQPDTSLLDTTGQLKTGIIHLAMILISTNPGCKKWNGTSLLCGNMLIFRRVTSSQSVSTVFFLSRNCKSIVGRCCEKRDNRLIILSISMLMLPWAGLLLKMFLNITTLWDHCFSNRFLSKFNLAFLFLWL